MKRRRFIALIAAAAARPHSVHAQQPSRIPRVGILVPGPLAGRTTQRDAFRVFQEPLAQLGFVEGKTILFDVAAAPHEGDPLEDLVADLVRLKVDVIVTVGDQATQAARLATSTIPIVMCPSQDAVGLGFVASLGRPGGNITGVSILNTDLAGKRLQILMDIVPRVSRIAVMWSEPDAPFRATKLAAQAARVEILSLKVSSERDLDKSFETAAASGVGALLVAGGPTLFGLRERVTGLAQSYGLPAVYYLPGFAHVGGLVAYGPSNVEYFRQAAVYVGKILNGANPASLPVEQPTKIEMIVNLKTAKALGLTIPPSLLARADEVIE